MKISYVISYQKTTFKAAGLGHFDDNVSLLSDLGYEGIEIAFKDPESINPFFLESKLNKCKLKLVAIGTGQAYVDEGISLMDLDAHVRQEAIRRMKKHVDLASHFGSQVILGLIRGRIFDSTSKERQIDFLETSIVKICSYAERKKVIVTIEPLNRYECNTLNTAEEVVGLIIKIKSPFLKLLLDTFHMNIEERNMIKPFMESKDYLSHIHIADSNRKFPGMGHIDFFKICNALRKINFEGYLSGEMLPYPNIKTSMREYILKMKEAISGQTMDADRVK